MSLEDQAKVVTKLGELGTDIPGLNADSIIENLVKKDPALASYLELIDDEAVDNVERGMSVEEARAEAEETKRQAIETLKKSIKPAVEEDIIKMKQEYKIAKEALDSIPTEAQAAIANSIIPPSISAPPSTANPAYTLGIALQTKKNLLKTLNIVLASLTTVMMIANKLKFEVPAPVLALVSALTVATTALSVIPG